MIGPVIKLIGLERLIRAIKPSWWLVFGNSSAIKYEVALKADQFLLMVHGSEAEIQHARSMLDGPKKQLAYEHQLPDELSK